MTDEYEERLREFSANKTRSSSGTGLLSNLFGNKGSNSYGTSDSSPSRGNNNEESQSMFESLLGNVRSRTQDTMNSIGISTNTTRSEDLDCLGLSRFQRYGSFIFIMFLSAMCFSMAIFSLFMLSPTKFASSWTIASILVLFGMGVFKGFYPFFKHTFSLQRLPFTLIYFGSLGSTLYFVFTNTSFILVLLASLVQIVALFWYFGSYLPGGTAGLSSASRFFASRAVGLPV